MSARRAEGFSLIEVLIVVGVIGLIAVPLVDLLLGYNRLFGNQEAAVEVNVSADAIIREVHTALLQADSVVSSHTFSGSTYTSGTTTLVLKLPAIDAAGNIVSGSYDYVGFYASGTDAYIVVDAAAGSARSALSKRLSAALSSLSFSYNTASVIAATSTGVDVVTRSDVRGTILERHLAATTTLRNI